MNKRLYRILHSNKTKRIVSAAAAIAMLFEVLPVPELGSGIMEWTSSIISASAAVPVDPNFGSGTITVDIANLQRYSQAYQNYPAYHQNDIITISAAAGTDPNMDINNFNSLGTAQYPFNGQIKVSSSFSSMVLNLDAPLFNYVYDTVTLNDSNSARPLKIARLYKSNNKTKPIIANHIVHNADSASSSAATWHIDFTAPSTGSSTLTAFGGFIGRMWKDFENIDAEISPDCTGSAELNVVISMYSASDDDTSDIYGSGDTGLICGRMDESTVLNFSLTTDRTINDISTSTGNVGGLAGYVDKGASLNYSGPVDVQAEGKLIKTSAQGYAGGIVGYNNDGVIELPSSEKWPVKQIINGAQGEGGVYGYFSVEAAGLVDIAASGDNPAVEKAFRTSKYEIDCELKGAGYAGGLFGVLQSTNNIEIIVDENVESSHSATKADSYGGLIGKYTVDSKDHSLTVKGTSGKAVSAANAGDSTYYGGGIGTIDSSTTSYVKFDSFALDSAANVGTLTFGGLAASADNAFIEAVAPVIKIASGEKFKGGGLVGHLDHGVLKMSGVTDLSAAQANEPSVKESDGEWTMVGQLVGYRDDAIIYGTSDWTFKRSTSGANVDDIGGWGEVIRLSASGLSGLFTESDHVLTVAQPKTTISSLLDFAAAALCFQINAENNPYVEFASDAYEFASDAYTWDTINSETITLTADLDLSGTGFTGLTRDNDVGVTEKKHIFSGTLTSDSTVRTVTLAIGEYYGNRGSTAISGHTTAGDGTIYRHKYNGFVGEAAGVDGSTVNITNISFDGSVNVKAQVPMYAGSAAASASGDIVISGIESAVDFDHAGGGDLSLGGILGEATAQIGDITVSDCTVTCDIDGTASSESFFAGGVIGKISAADNDEHNWSLSGVIVSGSISNTWGVKDNHLSGLISTITGCSVGSNATQRTLTLDNITVSGLKIFASSSDPSNRNTRSLSGLLAYSWNNVEVDFNGVAVSDCTLDLDNIEAGYGDTAGLVYGGTGYWKLETADDVTITDITVNNGGMSFGMFLNRAWNGDDKTQDSSSALYLEISDTDAYVISLSDDLPAFTTFDELVAYSARFRQDDTTRYPAPKGDDYNYYVLQNGQSIISIKTDIETGLYMDNGTNASGSYTAQTSSGNCANPYTRYYYNIDTVKEGTSDPELLMRWGLRQYAHKSIKSYFDYGGDFSDSAIPGGDYDMQGYSWYPVDIDSSVTVNGTFKFYNKEFEGSEEEAVSSTSGHSFDRTSLSSSTVTATQHYTLQNGLFRNVNSGCTLNIGTVTLRGNVGKTSYGSGALISGRVQGVQDHEAAVKVSSSGSIILEQVYVHDISTANTEYAPLAINKVGNYSRLEISANTSDDFDYFYSDMDSESFPGLIENNGYPKAGTSLIGDVGMASSPVGIILIFNKMVLDGRTAGIKDSSGSSDTDGDDYLLEVYGSERAIFTKATFLNSLKYDSGSFGKYDFTWDQDWKRTNRIIPRYVTYGKELGYTDDFTSTEYPGEELWYSGEPVSGSSVKRYVNPDDNNDTTGWYSTNFRNDFLPYVYTAYNKTNKTHQIMVNHSSAAFDGCGTYNDPYMITSGNQLVTVSKILNGAAPANNFKLSIPKNSSGNISITETWHDKIKGHATFKYYNPEDPTYVEGEDTYTIVYPAGYYLDGYSLPTTPNGSFTKNEDNKTYTFKTDTNTSYFLTNKSIETYLAGAYYKIGAVEKIELAANSGFVGLGYHGASDANYQHAIFRGVFIGDNKEIVNKTSNPFIFTSNGCVVKDLTVSVQYASDISVSGRQNTFKADQYLSAYGGLIGKVLGGDNIIDNVLVDYSSFSKQLKADGSYAQLAPIGGYIGVVVNGGVIFRNMTSRAATYETKGLTNAKITASGNYPSALTINNMLDEANKGWLYVNPIIGRVINGYAVTEGDSYRPFENGYREYGDGTIEVMGSNGSVSTYTPVMLKNMSAAQKAYLKVSGAGVTLKNGTKHYSITDIKSVWGKDSNGNISQTYKNDQNEDVKYLPDSEKLDTNTSGDIKVPNAQSWFVMSLLVNSGLAKKTLGYNQNYQMPRSGLYNNVKTDTDATDKPSDYTNYASKEYLSNNKVKDSREGYLAQFYITSISNLGNIKDKVTLTGSDVYYLPDGYKGLGNIYQSGDDTRVSISSLDGKNNIVSQNTLHYYYNSDFDKNYTAANNNEYQNGMGLITYQKVSSNVKDIILKGNVKADIIDKDWSSVDSDVGYAHIAYSGNIYTARMISVGSLFGCVGAAQTINSVGLQNVDVRGVRYVGGMIGTTNTFKTTIRNPNKVESNRIKVHSGLIAGGVIGKIYQHVIDFDFNNCSFSITEVVSECTATPDALYYNYGVGGIIGMCRSKISNQTGENIIKNVIIGSENDTECAIVKCEKANIYTGGLVGIFNRAYLKLSNCKIYNMNVESKFAAGGLVGHWATAGGTSSTAEQLQSIISNTIVSGTITGKMPEIKSTGSEKYCSAGGFLGSGKDDMNNVIIQNCSIEKYKVTGNVYAGGAVGSWGDSSTSDTNNWKSATVQFNNFKINDCTIGATDSSGAAGGLLGNLNGGDNKASNTGAVLKTYNFRLYGYNVLSKNLTITGTNKGYICGRNGRTDTNDIKIAGYSRQDTDSDRMISKLVGTAFTNGTTSSSVPYGNNGYVIFADYNDKASANDPNKRFSNVTTSGISVKTMRSVTTYTEDDVEKTVYGDYYTANETAANSEAGYTYTESGISKNVKNENYPYVTSNPKQMIDGTNYITGDAGGFTQPDYSYSVFKTIITDTGNKKYTNYPALSNETKSYIESHFSSAHEEFIKLENGIVDFPLLVVEDTDEAKITDMINSYIRVLTNTDNTYNYASDVTNVFHTEIVKMQFANGVFTKVGTPNLEITTNGKFRMKNNSFDTSETPTFTLIDVQFYDPSSSGSSIAYHLYVPVYIKKLLEYNFYASLASNTDYFKEGAGYQLKDGYFNSNKFFENIGNPVTLGFEYVYTRSSSEWATALNGGENVLGANNFYKSLIITCNNVKEWPQDLQLVLVDATKNGKNYYLDNADLPTMPSGSSINVELQLNKFKAADGSNTYYQPAPFNDLITNITFEQATAETGALIRTETETEYTTFKYGNYFYQPKGNATTGYFVNVTSVTMKPERYYLSFFTKKMPADGETGYDAAEYNKVFYYSIKSKEKFEQDSSGDGNVDIAAKDWRPNKVVNNSYPYLLMGNLYNTTIDVEADSFKHTALMSGVNNYLDIKMTSTVELIDSAKNNEAITDAFKLIRGEIANISQTFLMAYSMLEEVGGDEQVGIVRGAGVPVEINYYAAGGTYDFDDPTDAASFETNKENVYNPDYIKETNNYLQLGNDVNLLDYLGYSENDYAVTLQVNYQYLYDSAGLANQFPNWDSTDTEHPLGSKVIGYSNISSTSESAAYSATSVKGEPADQIRYYTEGTSKSAILSYNMVEKNTPDYTDGMTQAKREEAAEEFKKEKADGKYRSLGINALTEAKGHIIARADYDVSMLAVQGDDIELTLTLSKKSSYVRPAEGDPTNEGTALPIADYISGLKIYGKNNVLLFDQDAITAGTFIPQAGVTTAVSKQVSTTKTIANGYIYVLRMPKTLAETLTEDSTDRYVFRMEYDIFTGDGENKWNEEYSNYKVSLTAEMYNTGETARIKNSFDNDHLIYTNAKVQSKVI